jgi:hypothetical protein
MGSGLRPSAPAGFNPSYIAIPLALSLLPLTFFFMRFWRIMIFMRLELPTTFNWAMYP